MVNKYSQLRAMLAITIASLKAVFRSPSAVIFSIAFPLIFILVFGFIGNSGVVSLDVALNSRADTASTLYRAIKDIDGLHFSEESPTLIHEALQKGDLTAIIDIQKNKSSNPAYIIKLKSSEAVNPQNLEVLHSILNAVIAKVNKNTYPNVPTVATISSDVQKIPGRVYRRIDFILPGQLGFSLLSAGVFGVAFLFFNLRQQLVLKRFFATPIRRTYIILGEAFSRVIFQMITAIIIIAVGTIAFHFTLVNGLSTFLEIMLLSFIALIVFMGCGFIVSGLAKNESSIPPFANLFTLPQFLLAGTFFPISVFPQWLQYFCNILPLTHFNNAMRSISFEGVSIWNCGKELGILAIWGIVVYAIAVKVFRWE